MHSGFLILVWLTGLAVLQLLSFEWLLLALVACALVAVSFAPRRTWRLLKRVRFLLLAIVILFAGFTPGEAVLADWPALSPSREGLILAAEHAGRLVAVVLCVALLMERLAAHRLVGGLYALFRPFQSVGFPAGRVAVRTLLVLRYVESGAPKGWKAWLEHEDAEPAEAIEIIRERFGWPDLVVLLAIVLAVSALGLTR